jgi:hypothetical protein
MKNQLSDIYDQILLNEAEKHNLQNPSADEIGSLKVKQDLFGTKPKPVEGPEKAKLQKGPSYQETTGTTSAPKKASGSSMPKSEPAKATQGPKGKEMEDTDVDPTDHEEEESSEEPKKKDKTQKESFTMSAFETLFKKTLNEEMGEEAPVAPEPVADTATPDIDVDIDADIEDTEEETEEDEGDLISDLRELQDKLSSILDKLEDLESEEEMEGGDEYSEEEFDDEFGGEEVEGEESPMKESIDKMKPLNSSKGKSLMSKKNKVGKLSAKGGKAKGAALKVQPSPTALGDKKKSLQSGNKVRSSIQKGDFIK